MALEYLFNLSSEYYDTLQKHVKESSAGYKAVQLAVKTDDGFAFPCSSDEFTSIIKDLDYQSGAGRVVAELIAQQSSQNPKRTSKRE